MATVDTAWHLDKKVPIVLMFTIFIQSATAVWWASSIESRMQAVSQSDDRQGECDGRDPDGATDRAQGSAG